MNYFEAKSKSLKLKLVGFPIAALAGVSTIISFMKVLGYTQNEGSELTNIILRPLYVLIELIYQNTQFLSWFWIYSPMPNVKNISDSHTIAALVIYIFSLTGFAIYVVGRNLKNRLKKIDRKIEDQMLEDSVRGAPRRTRQQIQQQAELPSSGSFSSFHTLYLAPLIVTVIGGIILYFAGVS